MNETIAKWLNSNYKNYLKKNSPLDQSIIDHIVDWLSSDEGSKYLVRLDRVSVPTAVDLSNRWTVQLNKKNEKTLKKIENLSGVEILYSFNNNYSIVELKSVESFQREGSLMGHCVGSYANRDDIRIFSLRDQNNEPHCTIEFDPKSRSIEQIKGKSNRQVIEKYHPFVAEFLNQFDFDSAYSYDLKNIASIYFGNHILLTNQMPINLEIKKDLKIDLTNYLHTFNELKVNGTAFLSKNRRCRKIAESLIIHGDLIIEEYHGLLKLAENLIVHGHIEITNCENIKLLATNIRAESITIIDCPSFSQKINNISTEILFER